MRFCLVGRNGHTLLALDHRVVVIKAGKFGGRAASFEFSEIDAIEVGTGRKNGSIEVHTAVLGTIKADDFCGPRQHDGSVQGAEPPLPIVSSDLQAYEPS